MKFKRALNYLRSELKASEERIDYCNRITEHLEKKEYEVVFFEENPTEKEIEFKKYDISQMLEGWMLAKEELEFEILELEKIG